MHLLSHACTHDRTQLKVAGGNIVLEAYFMTGISGDMAPRGAACVRVLQLRVAGIGLVSHV